jgi:hypothetical protein
MGARYSATRTTTALSTTNDAMTIICPSTRALKVWEVSVGGAGTTSGYNEVLFSRSSGGTTGGGAITPTPLATLSAASGVTVNTTWSGQPTIGVTILRIPVNQNGGVYRYVLPPGMEIDVPPSGQLSIRSASGTNNVTVSVIWEEVG